MPTYSASSRVASASSPSGRSSTPVTRSAECGAVTPEVAGSSPVAPVLRSLAVAGLFCWAARGFDHRAGDGYHIWGPNREAAWLGFTPACGMGAIPLGSTLRPAASGRNPDLNRRHHDF